MLDSQQSISKVKVNSQVTVVDRQWPSKSQWFSHQLKCKVKLQPLPKMVGQLWLVWLILSSNNRTVIEIESIFVTAWGRWYLLFIDDYIWYLSLSEVKIHVRDEYIKPAPNLTRTPMKNDSCALIMKMEPGLEEERENRDVLE